MNRLLLLLLLLTGCKSQEEKTTEYLDQAVRQYFEDYAFKANKKLTLLEITGLRYRLINRSMADTMALEAVAQKEDHYLSMMNHTLKEARLYLNQQILHSDMDMDDLAEMDGISVNEKLKENQLQEKEAARYHSYDSLIRIRLKRAKAEPPTIYRVKYHIKATIGDENVMDTLTMLFDKQYRIIDFKDPAIYLAR